MVEFDYRQKIALKKGGGFHGNFSFHLGSFMLLCLKIIKNLNATVDSFLGIWVKVVLKALFTTLYMVSLSLF